MTSVATASRWLRVSSCIPMLFLGAACSPTITRVSLAPEGAQLNGGSSGLALSDDGGVVVFVTTATNLPHSPPGGGYSLLVNDRTHGSITQLDRSSVGGDPILWATSQELSSDGRDFVFGVSGNPSQTWSLDVTTFAPTLVSATPSGAPGAGASMNPSMSADGSLVAFESTAPDLVPGDTNQASDIFVWHRDTRAIERVSVASDGTQANGDSQYAWLSSDGKIVAFSSRATNLDPANTSTQGSIYLHDLETGSTRVIVDLPSPQGALEPEIDDAGNRLIYEVSECPFRCGIEVHVRDLATGSDAQLLGSFYGPEAARLSTDGRLLSFGTDATLSPADTNAGQADVYVDDLSTGAQALASVDAQGTQANGETFPNGMSRDGRLVLFSSYGSNLASGDTNGVEDVFLAPNPLAH